MEWSDHFESIAQRRALKGLRRALNSLADQYASAIISPSANAEHPQVSIPAILFDEGKC